MKYLCPYVAILSVFVGCEVSPEDPMPVPYVNWESASVISNGIRIHYWRTGGAGKPVMIMAHGVTDYGLSWSSLAAKFQTEYDVIMFDARGHGFSEKPEGPYDLTTHVEDLVGLIKALDIQKPILIGHSMGSGTVALTAATYPNIPRAIIMEDPPLTELLEYLKDFHVQEWKGWIESDKAMGKQALMKLARSKRHPGWSVFEYDHWAEAKLLVCSNVVDVLLDENLRDPARIYPKITIPALILKADTDPEHRKKNLKIAGLLPNGKLIHIDGAGHLVRLDKPYETELQIRAFLVKLKN
ncbi:MAG: alpha/beta hydrolase [Sedimentisphaerales bacterium]|nr:alpha/beta hydrolase [Sedimentisphaerales bacterium]